MFKRNQRSDHSSKSYGIDNHADKSSNVDTSSGTLSLSSNHQYKNNSNKKTNMKQQNKPPSTVASTLSTSRSCYDDDISSPRSASKQLQRSVLFSFVHIREFERILGDNPSCSTGAPISIGWGYGNERSLDLDQYEQHKQSKVLHRKKSKNLMLSRQAREDLLLDWGTSFNDIIESIRSNVKVKNQRRRTVNAIGSYDRWEEVMENASRKIKRTLQLKSKKDENALLLFNSITRNGDKLSEAKRSNIPSLRMRSSEHFSAEDRSVAQLTNNSSSSRGSAGTFASGRHSQQHVIGRLSSHTNKTIRSRYTIGTVATDNTQKRDSEEIAPMSEIRITISSVTVDEVENSAASKVYDDDVDEDITITSHDPDDECSQGLPNGAGNNFYIRAMEDPRFLEAMDDPGAFYDLEDFDNMTTCTPMSQFTYGANGDDDDDDDDDEDDNEVAKNTYWNIRNAGQQDIPADRNDTNQIPSIDRWSDHCPQQVHC